MTMVPTTSAASGASRRLACPEHGFLPAGGVGCTRCDKSAYDVDSVDERSMLQSLRGVARSSRMTRARIICFPLALVGLTVVLGFGAVSMLLTPVVGEPLARAFEKVLMRLQPTPQRALDLEIL